MKNKIQSLTKLYSGKVRDLYDIDSKTMLMVASDRLSTFDIVLNQTIPAKGIYLTQISLFWFNYFKNTIPNHLTDIKVGSLLEGKELEYAQLRSVIVKKLKPIPIEVIVRGYLAGSGYKEYKENHKICGIKLPLKLANAAKLPEPIFTPSTKASDGDHDINISLTKCKNLIGKVLTDRIQEVALTIYTRACTVAEQSDLIIADTKLEFGLDEDDNLILMDEVLTPDSSRFWDKNTYKPGANPPSFDKQYVRDYLEKDLGWNKSPPIPNLPNSIIQKTGEKYYEIIKRLGVQYTS